MKVIGLRAENVKVLKAVDIEPDKHFQIVSGPNGAGKSTLIDSIWLALQGAKVMKDMDNPIRHGEEKAEVEVDLGEITVKRVLKQGGSPKLEARAKDGSKINSPQSLLDSLVGSLSFDPLEFANMKPADQRSTLMNLLGIDTTEFDKRKAELAEKRLLKGRKRDEYKGQLAGLKEFKARGEEEKELVVSELIQELQEVHNQKQQNEDERRKLQDLYKEHEQRSNNVLTWEARVEQLKRELAAAEETLALEKAELSLVLEEGVKQRELVDSLVDPDDSEIQQKLASIDEENKAIRQRNEYRRVNKLWTEADREYEELTKQIAAVEKERTEAIKGVQFPIEGLGISEEGVTYQKSPDSPAEPLNDISSGMQLKVSVAVAMALNPNIRVIRIKDGSLLDKKNLEVIREMAVEKDFQVWCEIVDSEKGVGINIEDGEVIE